MSENILRNSDKIIVSLSADEKEFIKSKSEEKKLFVGIRNCELKIYSYGALVLSVSAPNNELIYKTSYLPNNIDEKNEIGEPQEIKFEVLKNNHIFDEIISIAKHVYMGQNKDKKFYSEKICQQWIVNTTNNDEKNDWYYVDMEYENQGINIGRFDMVAISKYPVLGKHKVRLIELKVGAGSYQDKWDKNDPKFIFIKKSPNDFFLENNIELSFGSGIVGHIADFLRFLQNKNYYIKLKENIVSILTCNRKLGIEVPRIIDENDLEDKPEVLIVTYTHCPYCAYDDIYNDLTDNQKNLVNQKNIKCEIKSLKKRLRNRLFNINKSSVYNLESALNKEIISGFLNLKKYNNFSNSQEIYQKIGNEKYKFTFSFIDPDEEKDSWCCIK